MLPAPHTYVQISSSGTKPQTNFDVENSCKKKKLRNYLINEHIIHYSDPFSSQMVCEHYTLCNITNAQNILSI